MHTVQLTWADEIEAAGIHEPHKGILISCRRAVKTPDAWRVCLQNPNDVVTIHMCQACAESLKRIGVLLGAPEPDSDLPYFELSFHPDPPPVYDVPAGFTRMRAPSKHGKEIPLSAMGEGPGIAMLRAFIEAGDK